MTPSSSFSGFQSTPELVIDRVVAFQVMADHIYDIGVAESWFSLDPNIVSGVAIRVEKGLYVISPRNDSRLDQFKASLIELNQEVVVTFSARVVQNVTNSLRDDFAPSLALNSSNNVQIIKEMEELGGVRNAQGACFIKNEGILVLWSSKTTELEAHVQRFELYLIDFVWRCASHSSKSSLYLPSSDVSLAPKSIKSTPKNFASRLTSLWRRDNSAPGLHDEKEKYHDEPLFEARTYCRNKDFYTGIALAMDILICCVTAKTYLRESLIDGNWSRMIICASFPFVFAVAFFFCETIVGVLSLIFGPIGQFGRNSVYFSSVPPARLTRNFPHVTIMIPVYKESLVGVLAPTIESVQHAIKTYELQGGTANLLICEDGLQVVNADEAAERVDYYERNSCAYVARHPSNRAGRFKKSSNMNTAMELSLRVEVLLAEERTAHANYSQYDEDILYEQVLQQALLELEGRVWAQGDIRIGDYILLLDSDTRIPVDCFLDSVSEMEQCPDVAILQHCSGTFLAGAGYFETCIAFFTQMVQYSISLVVSNGILAPFLGHNAFLRWSAIQEQALLFGGAEKKIWSENHVSEDFVLSLNLASAGYLIRWVTYTKSQFLEGVSLSCDDEVNRWQKYAFGCSEVIFNPLRYWFTKSPLSSLYLKFLRNKGTTLASKFTTTSYIFSYWAIACGAPVTIGTYASALYYRDDTDPGNLTPFSASLTLIVVFTLGASVAFVVSRYRSRDSGFWDAVWPQIRGTVFVAVFFAGLSWHVMIALIAHMVSYNMIWSTTIKDVTDTSFFEELPRVLRTYWHIFSIMVSIFAAVMIFTTPLVGLHLQQTNIDYIYPIIWSSLGHILYPILLNPTLMLFRF